MGYRFYSRGLHPPTCLKNGHSHRSLSADTPSTSRQRISPSTRQIIGDHCRRSSPGPWLGRSAHQRCPRWVYPGSTSGSPHRRGRHRPPATVPRPPAPVLRLHGLPPATVCGKVARRELLPPLMEGDHQIEHRSLGHPRSPSASLDPPSLSLACTLRLRYPPNPRVRFTLDQYTTTGHVLWPLLGLNPLAFPGLQEEDSKGVSSINSKAGMTRLNSVDLPPLAVG